MKREKQKSKKVWCAFWVTLFAVCGYCLITNQKQAIADERNYKEVGSEKKLYDTMAGLSKGKFPSENSNINSLHGVYTLDEHSDEQYPVHFYSGSRIGLYNHVRFAGFCWMAVRTTTNGGVKLIYNGTPFSDGRCPDGTRQDQSRIGVSAWNSDYLGIEKAGYMYGDGDDTPVESIRDHLYFTRNREVYGHDVEWDGTQYTLVDTITVGYINSTSNNLSSELQPFATHHYTCGSTSTTCTQVYYLYNPDGSAKVLSNGQKYDVIQEKMFSGYNHSSLVKTMVDNWYAANMRGYTSQLEDAVYCSDRTLKTGPFVSNDESIVGSGLFASFWRNSNGVYSVDCSNARDAFTVSGVNGNGKLTYPVGLLTMDEARLAGTSIAYGYLSMSTQSSSSSTTHSWSMSPYTVINSSSRGTLYMIARNGMGGDFKAATYTETGSVRPVVTVNKDALVYCGSGTTTEPYALADEYCDHIYVEDGDMYKALRDCDLEKCPELKKDAFFDDEEQMIRLPAISHVYDLNLDNSNLKDVSDLVVFEKLKNLSLRNNHIEDISPLVSFTNLESTIQLAGNNIWDTDPISDICAARVDHFYDWWWDMEFTPEPCADGSYDGALNLAFDWITSQKLEDYYEEETYELPSTMLVARYLTEMVFDYQPVEDENACNPEIEWCYEPYYRYDYDDEITPAVDIAQYFDDSIKPKDLLYIKNATLETGDEFDTLHMSDLSKEVVLSYRISWKKLFGSNWDTMDANMKADIISRTGGNGEYWEIATIMLHPTHEPVPESPQTMDNIITGVIGLATTLFGGFVVFRSVAKRR